MQVSTGKRALILPSVLEGIDHGGIALQRNILAQAIFKRASNERTLLRAGCFALDKGCQGHHRHDGAAMFQAGRIALTLWRSNALPFFLEFMNHFSGHIRCSWMPGQEICRGKEKALESFG